ncbi:hypothetical protein vseg_008225, partial [Gypsophila vaccaria]
MPTITSSLFSLLINTPISSYLFPNTNTNTITTP